MADLERSLNDRGIGTEVTVITPMQLDVTVASVVRDSLPFMIVVSYDDARDNLVSVKCLRYRPFKGTLNCNHATLLGDFIVLVPSRNSLGSRALARGSCTFEGGAAARGRGSRAW